MTSRWAPLSLGLVTLGGALVAVEGSIDRGWINGYVVPRPSAVLASLPRVVREEGVLSRFAATAAEALAAGVLVAAVGTALGWFLYRRQVWRHAVSTWVAT